jgi:hypothetical protein
MPQARRLRRRASHRRRRTPDCGPSSPSSRTQLRRSAGIVGRELSQLETGRTDADYGSAITADEAGEAIAKAEHVLQGVERAIEAGLGGP